MDISRVSAFFTECTELLRGRVKYLTIYTALLAVAHLVTFCIRIFHMGVGDKCHWYSPSKGMYRL